MYLFHQNYLKSLLIVWNLFLNISDVIIKPIEFDGPNLFIRPCIIFFFLKLVLSFLKRFSGKFYYTFEIGIHNSYFSKLHWSFY